MKKVFLTLLLCCGMYAATAQTADYRVVPLPQEINLEEGTGFELNGTTAIVYNGDKAMKRNAQMLAGYIKEITGLELKIAKSKKSRVNAINLIIANFGNTVRDICPLLRFLTFMEPDSASIRSLIIIKKEFAHSTTPRATKQL